MANGITFANVCCSVWRRGGPYVDVAARRAAVFDGHLPFAALAMVLPVAHMFLAEASQLDLNMFDCVDAMANMSCWPMGGRLTFGPAGILVAISSTSLQN